VLIIIEVQYYQIISGVKSMNDISGTKNSLEDELFWENATKYTAGSFDQPFVSEMAYMLVTLHRTGA
jgi:hypothetical protein